VVWQGNIAQTISLL